MRVAIADHPLLEAGVFTTSFDRPIGASASPACAWLTAWHEGTLRTLSVVWGTRALPGRTERAIVWYREILARLGAITTLASGGNPTGNAPGGVPPLEPL